MRDLVIFPWRRERRSGAADETAGRWWHLCSCTRGTSDHFPVALFLSVLDLTLMTPVTPSESGVLRDCLSSVEHHGPAVPAASIQKSFLCPPVLTLGQGQTQLGHRTFIQEVEMLLAVMSEGLPACQQVAQSSRAVPGHAGTSCHSSRGMGGGRPDLTVAAHF